MKNDETTLSAGQQHANAENNRERFQTVSLSGYAEGLGVLAEERRHRKPLVVRSLRPRFSGKVTRSKNGDSFPVDRADLEIQNLFGENIPWCSSVSTGFAGLRSNHYPG